MDYCCRYSSDTRHLQRKKGRENSSVRGNIPACGVGGRGGEWNHMDLVFNQPGRTLRRVLSPPSCFRRSVTNKRLCLLSFAAAWTQRHARLGNVQLGGGDGGGGFWRTLARSGDLSKTCFLPPHTPTVTYTQMDGQTAICRNIHDLSFSSSLLSCRVWIRFLSRVLTPTEGPLCLMWNV